MTRSVLVVILLALTVAPAAVAGTSSTVQFSATPFPATKTGHLTEQKVKALFLHDEKVRNWLARYPTRGRTIEATYLPLEAKWEVKVWADKAGEIATGKVDDVGGGVSEAWTGPQVAWGMARGGEGAFGGKQINNPWVWGGFCLAFLIGLADFRRLLSWRNLDLVALLSFSASLWYFNRGHVLTSVPLVYPPLIYLLLRAFWVGLRGRGTSGRATWPWWVLIGATVFLSSYRITLNVTNGNVIDVGYSGVIGAERIAHGQAPYCNFPVEDTQANCLPKGAKTTSLKACGPKNAAGEIRERIQTNGRCESANPQGDTYGPVAYEAYLPGYWLFGWTGKWDDLPAAHFTSIAWDVICLVGLFFVGRRFGGLELAAALSFAWAAYPFTQYASSSDTNDMIMPAFLIWGFWFASSSLARGVLAALGGWTKFAGLIVAPLWLTYPDRRPKTSFVIGFLVATLAAFSILLLEPNPLHAARIFWDRSFGWQLNRPAPFSIWDWRQYHADGLPDLHVVQRVLQALLVAAALVLPFWPRRKSPLQLAALTAALLLGFQLVLTYWIYLYIPWFFAFSALTTLAPAPVREVERVVEPRPAEVAAAS